MFLSLLRAHGEQAIAGLTHACQRSRPTTSRTAKNGLRVGKRIWAIALLLLGKADPTWSLLRHAPDPSGRSWVIHRLAPSGVDPRVILCRLDEEKNVSWLWRGNPSLYQSGPDRLPAADHNDVVPRPVTCTATTPIRYPRCWRSGLAAVEARGKDQPIDQQLMAGKIGGHLATPALAGLGSAANDRRQPTAAGITKQWYINGQGHTMVILIARSSS